MRELSNRNLEQLAEQDPVSRPLALLQLEALQTAVDPVWEQSASTIPVTLPKNEIPALHGQTVSVDTESVAELLERLVDVLASNDVVDDPATIAALKQLDPREIVEAAIEWNAGTLERLAMDLEIPLAILVTLGQCAALPILLACGRHILPTDTEINWQPGYCPICGNWPLLAELRGLDRQQWLRCGRCASAWRTRHQRCIFCNNTDHTKLGYMAPEAERESRRAVTCEVCHGYFKVLASVSPLAIADILRSDLESIELDIAALDAGYSRPERPGFQLDVQVIPDENSSGRASPWN
jgi:FdhE protein